MFLAIKYLLIFFCLFYSIFAAALPDDREKTLHIVADSYQFNYKTGLDIYEGHVKVDQGTTHLTADRLITQKNQQHKVIYAIAYGFQQLAEYITIPKPGDLELHAKAKMIKYYPSTSIIILDKNVAVNQGQNSFQGAHIIYNMNAQTVTAPASKSGRATIIIEPSQLKNDKS